MPAENDEKRSSGTSESVPSGRDRLQKRATSLILNQKKFLSHRPHPSPPWHLDLLGCLASLDHEAGASQSDRPKDTGMTNLSQQVQREAQRGLILRILVEWQLEWMPFGELRLQCMRRAGYPLAEADLQFHLNYLRGVGYVETKQLRAVRAGLELTAVRATPKAVDLVEGRISEDPAVGE